MQPLDQQPVEPGESWQLFLESLTALHASLDLERVLESALQAGAAIETGSWKEPAGRAKLAVILPRKAGDSTPLFVRAGRGFSNRDYQAIFLPAEGVIERVVKEGTAVLCQEFRNDPGLSRLESLPSPGGIYCLPIRLPEQTGVFLYAHPETDFFSDWRLRSLNLLASHFSIALQNAIRYRDLQLRLEQVEDFQEAARKQIARQLHDGPTQSVAALAMRVNIARRMAAKDAQSAVEEFEKIEAIARRATSELRQLIFEVFPQVLESHGLEPALVSLADRFGQFYTVQLHLQIDPGVIPRLTMSQQAAIYNISDLYLRTVRRKEGLKNIWVRMQSGAQEEAILEIEDDGPVVIPGGDFLGAETSDTEKALQTYIDGLGGTSTGFSGQDRAHFRITVPLVAGDEGCPGQVG